MYGYDGFDLDNLSDPCVMDFTKDFSEKLCSENHCKSPTLDLLGLETDPSCTTSKKTNLGKWQIYYSCEFENRGSPNLTEVEEILEKHTSVAL